MAVSTTATIREHLINLILNELDAEQLEWVLGYIKLIQLETEHQARYDPQQDSILSGEQIFDGLGNVSERVEVLLYGESSSHEMDTDQ